jgi:hypothetical protein
MITDEFAKLYDRLASFNGERILCLATTANVNNPPVLIGSLRQADGVLAGNLILRQTAILRDVIKRFDGLVSRFFVDCEVKAGVDLGAAALELIPLDKMLFFKPNDFTVEAADEWVAQRMQILKGARIAIVGAGNIGTKLALRLAERGGEVRLVGRRVETLEAAVQGLNTILIGGGTLIACPSIMEACSQAEVIIGCTAGTATIDADAVEISQASLLLDVGNGCFTRGAITTAQNQGRLLEVLSSAAGWEGFFRRYALTRKLQKGLGRRQIDNSAIWIASRGIMGATGDVLVDDILKPTRVIGVCNGLGDLIYGEEALHRIKTVEKILGIF